MNRGDTYSMPEHPNRPSSLGERSPASLMIFKKTECLVFFHQYHVARRWEQRAHISLASTSSIAFRKSRSIPWYLDSWPVIPALHDVVVWGSETNRGTGPNGTRDDLGSFPRPLEVSRTPKYDIGGHMLLPLPRVPRYYMQYILQLAIVNRNM